MSSALIPADSDPLGRTDRPLSITVDGASVTGVHGQTLATVLLAADRSTWRTATTGGARGVFCGIGVCFDCVATVNGIPDVRLCRRPARDGDAVTTQTRLGPHQTADTSAAPPHLAGDAPAAHSPNGNGVARPTDTDGGPR